MFCPPPLALALDRAVVRCTNSTPSHRVLNAEHRGSSLHVSMCECVCVCVWGGGGGGGGGGNAYLLTPLRRVLFPSDATLVPANANSLLTREKCLKTVRNVVKNRTYSTIHYSNQY